MVDRFAEDRPSFKAHFFDPDTSFYSLDDGNQNSLVCAAEIKKGWLEDLRSNYNWSHFDEYDNMFTEFTDFLFDDVIEGCGIEDQDDLWNAMNRHQKIFWAFLVFTGDVDTGGMHQFLFKRPQFIFAVYEMFDELKLEKLKEDYKLVLDELMGEQTQLAELRIAFEQGSQTFETRWNDFAAGYEEFRTSALIESYYYRSYFKRDIYRVMSDYIIANIESFTVFD